MSIRKIIPILFLAAVSASCKKKRVETDMKPADAALERCESARSNDAAECARTLSACMYEARAAESPTGTSATGVQAEADEFEINVGWTYVLGQGNQTVVMNPKPVDDGLRRFPRGATCRFDPEGRVKIIAAHDVRSEDGEIERDYLVRYTRDPAPEALKDGALEHPDSEPYECPDGTVFFLDDTSILEEDEPDARFKDARKLLDSEKP